MNTTEVVELMLQDNRPKRTSTPGKPYQGDRENDEVAAGEQSEMWWDAGDVPEEDAKTKGGGLPRAGYTPGRKKRGGDVAEVVGSRRAYARRLEDRRARQYIGGTIRDLAAAFRVKPATVRMWFFRGLLVSGVEEETAQAIASAARLFVRRGILRLEDILPQEDFEMVQRALGLRREGR